MSALYKNSWIHENEALVTRLSPPGVFASKVCASAKGQVEFVKAN